MSLAALAVGLGALALTPVQGGTRVTSVCSFVALAVPAARHKRCTPCRSGCCNRAGRAPASATAIIVIAD